MLDLDYGFKLKKERTIKASQKRKLKEEKKHKCQHCHKKFDDKLLTVHHIKPISKYKAREPSLFTYKKTTPAWDRKKNIKILCHNCHKRAHIKLSEKEKKRKDWHKKRKPKSILDFKIRPIRLK